MGVARHETSEATCYRLEADTGRGWMPAVGFSFTTLDAAMQALEAFVASERSLAARLVRARDGLMVCLIVTKKK